ncbi:MAG: Hpt domain-containing protein [Betaproteobacteria bacterium]|nr:Hpt domain-containing protein [Betaproteobacteria bacterium]
MFATIAKWIKPAVAMGPNAATATPIPSPVEGLPVLPGIDVKAGLAVSMNNMALYQRMLMKFRDSQGAFEQLFASARHDPDPAAATRCAHTLKGTAGNIGAKALERAAATLEHACQSGENESHLDKLLTQTLEALAPVIQGLNALAPKSETMPSVNTVQSPTGGASPKVSSSNCSSCWHKIWWMQSISGKISWMSLSAATPTIGAK